MNKNGWGLRIELVFILMFIICLLIATIGLNYLGLVGEEGAFDNNKNLSSYTELEHKLSTGALEYYNSRYNNSNEDAVIIKSSTLFANGYISNLYDKKGRKCKGYAKVLNNKTSVAYIKCPGYKTSGYDRNNE